MFGITRTKYYDWQQRYGTENQHNGKQPKEHWLTPEEIQAVIDYARKHIESNKYYLSDGYRRITYMGIDSNAFACAPATVYRILNKTGMLRRWKYKKNDSKGKGYKQPKSAHKEWHIDIKYINYRGTFLFFISIMDGYSRYIVHHDIRTAMTEREVELVVQRAHEKYPDKNPKIISDNGKQFVSKEFQDYLKELNMKHVRTSPSYPQSNGKIERFHRSLEDECLRKASLINIDDAKEQIAHYVDHYNNQRLHSALSYLRPIDYLNDNNKELLDIRKNKISTAIVDRIKYWEQKKQVA